MGENDGQHSALVSIEAIATNGSITTVIKDIGAGYLLAVKANQPRPHADVEACFEVVKPGVIETHTEHHKGHGRIEQRDVSIIREVGCLSGDPRFPGELRLLAASSIVSPCLRPTRREIP